MRPVGLRSSSAVLDLSLVISGNLANKGPSDWIIGTDIRIYDMFLTHLKMLVPRLNFRISEMSNSVQIKMNTV